jgi:hypothetical protein
MGTETLVAMFYCPRTGGAVRRRFQQRSGDRTASGHAAPDALTAQSGGALARSMSRPLYWSGSRQILIRHRLTATQFSSA